MKKYKVVGQPDTSATAKLRFLALGDSYTIGHSVEEDERWPVQLVDSLRLVFPHVSDACIIARTGWTTEELIQGIALEDPHGPFDLVSLLIGVNNQFRQLGTSGYRMELRTLLQMAVTFAGNDPGRVIVISIPDYGVTPFAQHMVPEKIAAEIDAYNETKRNESTNKGVAFIDVTPVSRLAADDLTLLAEDGLHPSGKMYAEWVKLIYPQAYKIIQHKIKQ